jgi:hypothetical protein
MQALSESDLFDDVAAGELNVDPRHLDDMLTAAGSIEEAKKDIAKLDASGAKYHSLDALTDEITALERVAPQKKFEQSEAPNSSVNVREQRTQQEQEQERLRKRKGSLGLPSRLAVPSSRPSSRAPSRPDSRASNASRISSRLGPAPKPPARLPLSRPTSRPQGTATKPSSLGDKGAADYLRFLDRSDSRASIATVSTISAVSAVSRLGPAPKPPSRGESQPAHAPPSTRPPQNQKRTFGSGDGEGEDEWNDSQGFEAKNFEYADSSDAEFEMGVNVEAEPEEREQMRINKLHEREGLASLGLLEDVAPPGVIAHDDEAHEDHGPKPKVPRTFWSAEESMEHSVGVVEDAHGYRCFGWG